MAKITVVGSFVMDMVARLEEFPKAGQTVLGKSLGIYPGGKGANQAVAARRLGGDVEMIGCVGKDGNGKTFLDLLRREGIETSHIKESEEVPTAIAQIQIDQAGENKIVVIPSANHAFTKEDLYAVKEVLSKTKLVVMQLELEYEVSLEILRVCKELEVPVILNPAPAVKLPKEILGLATYVTPNETELEILTGQKTETEEELYSAAEALLDMGVKTVVATLGKRGAMIATAERKQIIEGYRVKAVDTVAAGDSFNGALAKCIADGKDLAEAVRYANAVGALAVTKQGAIPSLPTAEEVDEFLFLVREKISN